MLDACRVWPWRRINRKLGRNFLLLFFILVKPVAIFLFNLIPKDGQTPTINVKQYWYRWLKRTPNSLWKLVKKECKQKPDALQTFINEYGFLSNFIQVASKKTEKDFRANFRRLMCSQVSLTHLTGLSLLQKCLLRKLSFRKSPGSDGIPNKIYAF